MVDVLDSDLDKTVQCDKIGCGKFFLATSAAPVAPPPPAPFDTTLKPRLTGPHRCLVCKGELGSALNRRRCTVLHRPKGGGDNCRMDVYAAIYFCPHCQPWTLLETPAYQWGRQVSCPVCEGRFQAPRDDVLLERDSHASEGVEMSFSCPSCERDLRCDSLRRGRPIRGARVVCLHCRHLIEVPPHGERVARRYRV
jgi:hypothetical protein